MKTQVRSGRYVRSHSQIADVLRFRPHLSHFIPASHCSSPLANTRSFSRATLALLGISRVRNSSNSLFHAYAQRWLSELGLGGVVFGQLKQPGAVAQQDCQEAADQLCRRYHHSGWMMWSAEEPWLGPLGIRVGLSHVDDMAMRSASMASHI